MDIDNYSVRRITSSRHWETVCTIPHSDVILLQSLPPFED